MPGAVAIERNVLEWRADPRGAWYDPRLAGRAGLLIVMCTQGYQSSLAESNLKEMGITDATDMIEGFEGWLRSSLPVQQWPEEPEPGGS